MAFENIRGLLTDENMYQMAGLLSQIPTFSGRPNPAANLGSPLMAQAERLRAQREQKERAGQVRDLLGTAPQEMAGPTRSGEALMGGGTGLLGGESTPQEFYGGLLAVPGYEKIGAAGLGAFAQQAAERPYYTPLQTSQGLYRFNARSGEIEPLLGAGDRPLLPPAIDPAVQAQVVGAKKAAEVTSGAEAQAQVELPQALETAQQTLELLDMAINHPGRAAATGRSSWLDPRNKIPGTDARNYIALEDQIKGKNFLQAFDSLKGGGQITEVEGKKAEQAQARLDRAQSDEEYLAALQELREIVVRGMQRAQQKAGRAPQQPASAPDPLGIR